MTRWAKVYDRFREFTMVEPRTFAANLDLVQAYSGVAGCVVECGVWRGGMMGAMASVLGPARNYVLFDSFEGLPKAQAVDGPAALAWQSDTQAKAYHDNCRADVAQVHRAMELACVAHYEVRAGWFGDTLPLFKPTEPIAVLRLDGDWYASTKVCLNVLFDRVAPGGLIIVDDYLVWDGCARAVHDFLSERKAAERIRTHDDRVAYIVKAQALPADGEKVLATWVDGASAVAVRRDGEWESPDQSRSLPPGMASRFIEPPVSWRAC